MVTSQPAPTFQAPVEGLLTDLKDAFEQEKARGEAINYIEQSPESQERLQAAVSVRRAATAVGVGSWAVGCPGHPRLHVQPSQSNGRPTGRPAVTMGCGRETT